MASPEFTNQGISIQTLAELIAELEAGYRAIYGENINLDQDSPDGQRVGIEAQARLDLQSFAVSIYNSMDPDLAEAVHLNKIIKLAGITRRPATRSTWDIDVTVDRPLTLSEGYSIEDDIGQLWELTGDVILTIGTTLVTFTSVEFGSVEGLSGAVLKQSDVVLGVTGLAAPGDAIVGIEEETDPDLRNRRNLSVQNPSYSTLGGLFAKLADLDGVTDVVVYENDTDAYDATLDLNAHHIWAVVEAGEVSAIAETIIKNKTAGAGLKGSVSSVYLEELIRPSGETFQIDHVAQFDRPTLVDLHVNVTATRVDSGSPIDIDLLKAELANKIYGIGEDAVASKLYPFGYNAGSNFVLSALEISDDGITFTDEDIDSAADGKFVIDTANITVVEVI